MSSKLGFRPSVVLLSLTSFAMASEAFAWGERGHDAVARVATRIVADNKDPDTARFGAFLQKRENMLGHLANVPDIVWRQISPEVDKLSSPSHFIDLEFILAPGKPASAADMPQTFEAYSKALQKNCDKNKGQKDSLYACSPGKSLDEKIQKAGHVPFRVEALSQDLVQTFKELKALEPSGNAKTDEGSKDKSKDKNAADDDKRTAVAERAILLMGVMSHFVGDLANPQHTAKDYDGWEADQGGLHGYFETDIVDSLGLDLEAQVLDEAERHQPMAELFAKHPRKTLLQAWELVLESHSYLPTLFSLDKEFAVTEKSVALKQEGDRDKRQKAKRKDVSEARSKFRNFVIMRLAAGSDALSRFWIDAWEQGGKPDFTFYRSYHYDVKPDFIPLRYIPAK